MSAGPTVSIIMPVRNEAASLDATLASVCSQATDASFEVIVVDDHSTDSTRSIVERWAARDERVRLVVNRRRGAANALNSGLEAARGRYLVRVDGHSSIPPDYVQALWDHMRSGACEGAGGPRLLYEKRRPSAQFRSYAGLTRAFFESIRAVSGKAVIVDSTKSSTRAFAFGMTPGIDLYVVHLVRDGRGVVASLKKTFRKDIRAGIMWDHEGRPMWKSVVRWIVRNLAAEWVCARLGPEKTMRLRYEDFVADPKGALERIGSLIGLDLTDVADAASSGRPMQAGHNIGGNRTKKSGTITLRPDAQEWRSALSPTEQRLSWASMGWLMRRYGYKR